MIGGRSVPVASGATLVGLVPTGAEIRQRVSVRAGVTFPPGVGQMVGKLVVSVPSFRVGRVPIVVAAVPGPPPPTDPGPWWRRAGSSVLGALDAVLDALFG
jgi:hypothetical protein